MLRSTLFLVIIQICGLCLAQNDPGLVTISDGPVRGVVSDSIIVWKGIPSASPPVGDNRWNAPQPPTPWTSVLAAKEFKPACPQNCVLPPSLCPNTTSEDCLYLNVWAPRKIPQGQLLPVMVFIAGGAYLQGDGSCPVYNAEYIANATSTVVITFNYRLGALGFMAAGNSLKGNFGIQDQRSVLLWVQHNIKAFGGDATRVTLFGESAGAASVTVHMISPKSKGLFHRAIVESNPFSIPFKTMAQSLVYGAKFSEAIGCDVDDLKCLRSKSSDEVLKVSDSTFPIPDPFTVTLFVALPWDPTIDGDEVPDQLMPAFAAGNYQKVPLIIGTNRNEGTMFVDGLLSVRIINVEYVTIVGVLFGLDTKKVLDMYPPPLDPLEDCRNLLSQLITDFVFTCPTRMTSKIISKQSKVYLYEFDHVISFDAYGPRLQFCNDKVCHGAELPFVFHSADNSGDDFTPEEEVLSKSMVRYWTNFASSKNASPNDDSWRGLSGSQAYPQWPEFDAGSLGNILLSVPISPQYDFREAYCDFWDTIGYTL